MIARYRFVLTNRPYLFLLSSSVISEAGDWAARLALSYLAVPNPALDLTDPAVARHLVTTYVLPGLRDDLAPSGVSSPAPSHAPSTILRLTAAPVPRTSRS